MSVSGARDTCGSIRELTVRTASDIHSRRSPCDKNAEASCSSNGLEAAGDENLRKKAKILSPRLNDLSHPIVKIHPPRPEGSLVSSSVRKAPCARDVGLCVSYLEPCPHAAQASN